MAAVSESQRDLSPADRPTRNSPDSPDDPKLDPSTVKLAEPVAAPFHDSAALSSAPWSQDSPRVLLPACWPLVTDTDLDASVLRPRLQETDESDLHIDCSQAVMPDRTSKLENAIPDPWIDTLTDPVDAQFDRRKALTKALSVDKDSDVLPGRPPADTCSR